MVAMRRMKRLVLLAVMSLAAVKLFTGAPILAIWVGSHVQGESGGLSMTAVLVVVLVLALLCWALVWALNRMGAAYDELVGRPHKRRQTTWMKPFNSPAGHSQGASLRTLDRILGLAVVLAGLAFEAWFFLLAGSSIGAG